MVPNAAKRVVDYACTVLHRSGNVPQDHLKGLIVEGDHPKDIILREAANHKVDLVVTGSRGLGRLRQLTLGSVSYSVAHHAATRSVLVVHSPLAATHSERPVRVLLCVDGSPQSLAAARALGALLNSSMVVHIISAQTPPHSLTVLNNPDGSARVVVTTHGDKDKEPFKQYCTNILREAKREMLAAAPEGRAPPDANISGVLAQTQDPKKALVDHIAQQSTPYDLIVCGSRGQGLWLRHCAHVVITLCFE